MTQVISSRSAAPPPAATSITASAYAAPAGPAMRVTFTHSATVPRRASSLGTTSSFPAQRRYATSRQQAWRRRFPLQRSATLMRHSNHRFIVRRCAGWRRRVSTSDDASDLFFAAPMRRVATASAATKVIIFAQRRCAGSRCCASTRGDASFFFRTAPPRLSATTSITASEFAALAGVAMQVFSRFSVRRASTRGDANLLSCAAPPRHAAAPLRRAAATISAI